MGALDYLQQLPETVNEICCEYLAVATSSIIMLLCYVYNIYKQYPHIYNSFYQIKHKTPLHILCNPTFVSCRDVIDSSSELLCQLLKIRMNKAEFSSKWGRGGINILWDVELGVTGSSETTNIIQNVYDANCFCYSIWHVFM